MNLPLRPGITVPFGGPLHAQRERFEQLADLGYTDMWSAESDGVDGFTPLALGSVWAPTMRLGTAIIPAFTRGPACMAQSVAALATAAPGRFAFGIGTSSNVIVERWNGIPFKEPYKRTRDMVRFLRTALTGEKVTQKYDTFEVSGYRLSAVPEVQPPILVAGLREGMLRLAGREADGAIINWLSPDDVAKVAPVVQKAGGGDPKEIVCRIFVCPSEDTEAVRAAGKFAIAAYLNVPVYAAFHEWLGRGETLTPMWEAWKAGDRKKAIEVIPDSLVDELLVHGSPAACRATIQRYFDNGVTTSTLAIMPLVPMDHWQAVKDLSPSAAS